MVQLSISKSDTPARLTLQVMLDPYDPDDRMTVSAVVAAVDGGILAAHSVLLRGMEQDLVDSVVEAVVNSYRWGSPATDLAPAMRRVKREAMRHVKAHERR